MTHVKSTMPPDQSADVDLRRFWDEWGFADDGKPEDAAAYILGVLECIKRNDCYLQHIGNIDGQQQFLFQWLISHGLIERGRSTRDHRLSTKGERARVLLSDAAIDLFLS